MMEEYEKTHTNEENVRMFEQVIAEIEYRRE